MSLFFLLQLFCLEVIPNANILWITWRITLYLAWEHNDVQNTHPLHTWEETFLVLLILTYWKRAAVSSAIRGAGREGQWEIKIRRGSNRMEDWLQVGRGVGHPRGGACCVVLLHIYKWCIANFLPSQHQSVWHSCNALHSTAPVHQPRLCTTDANCTELLLCTMVAPPCTTVQCRSLQCTVCTTVQCSAVRVSINVSGTSLLAHCTGWALP